MQLVKDCFKIFNIDIDYIILELKIPRNKKLQIDGGITYFIAHF